MTKNFKPIDLEKFNESTFKLFGTDWMLITAGEMKNFNMMTVSWGGMGILWYKPVVFLVIRPQRHTFKYIEANNIFTLTFFEEKYRKMLNLLGSKSGRNTDKLNLSGLTPLETQNGGIYYEEARMVLECRKLYFHDLTPDNMLLSEIQINYYPTNDFHRLYVAEIIQSFSE